MSRTRSRVARQPRRQSFQRGLITNFSTQRQRYFYISVLPGFIVPGRFRLPQTVLISAIFVFEHETQASCCLRPLAACYVLAGRSTVSRAVWQGRFVVLVAIWFLLTTPR